MKTKETISTNPSLIERMFEAGAHFGYSRSRRHPSSARFLFGSKGGSDIIDLEKTHSHLGKALDAVREYAAKGKTVLLVGTKPEAREAVKEIATALVLPYVTYKWIGGTLTNFSEIRKRVERLRMLKGQKERGDLDVYSKKERRDLEDEITRLERNFGGVVTLERIPEALFVIDPRHEDTAVTEAKKLGVSVIALANSDCNIKDIQCPIPGNDSSRSSIRFFLEQMKSAFIDGTERKELAKVAALEAVKNAEVLAAQEKEKEVARAKETPEEVK